MGLSASEQATIHFYEWEKRIRGHYHFDTTVELEPYYVPFENTDNNTSQYIDDGKAPSIFGRIGKLLNLQEKTDAIEEPDDPLMAHIYKPTTDLVGFSLTFPLGSEIQPQLFREFLHLITYTEEPMSFEIIGTSEDINIQIVSSTGDSQRIHSQLRAYFPHVNIKPIVDVYEIGIDLYSEEITIVDFGLSQETMRPLASNDNFRIDPLTSIIATMDSLEEYDVAIFQVLFQGVQNSWANDMQYSVSDGTGGSFFSNSPEMPNLAKEKTAEPLFSVVMRVAVESDSNERSEYLASEFIRNITTVSQSSYNSLIPLNNKDYDYQQHLRNVFLRCSNRLGFLLNTRELVQFVHYPNRTVVSAKLGIQGGKTKSLPTEVINQAYVIGVNQHNGVLQDVSLNDEMRLRHTHIIGATGVGKSTLIANMVLADVEQGNGCAIFDPHGDICDDILARIPAHRVHDVILIDPSDLDYPIGFNLLGASTEAEKIVLSSDLVASFKRYATSWGDNMTAVLSNAINTFLEHPDGGTIIELKRFILEDKFRNEFLKNVDDPSLHYYWKNEYPMVRKRIAPLLTRIDTFLRPKTVRYMLAQKEGIDFKACIEEKKIILIKLSQGLIGEENSYLLGSLFLSKLNQVALGRQNLSKSERHPFYIYLDEFQNFITPSITSILSGARKYGLGLILAHQELAQIEDTKTLNSVISNPHIRICFRLGDTDAKKLESGFSFFEQSDVQSLGIGQAIMRIGSSSNDFNIQTAPLTKQNEEITQLIRTQVVEQTRSHYGKERSHIEQIIVDLLPKREGKTESKDVKLKEEKPTIEPLTTNNETQQEIESKPEIELQTEIKTPLEEQKEAYLESVTEKERTQKHRLLQEYVRTIGLQRGFKATLEDELPNGKRIDVTLVKDELRIAIEISVTNTIDYEVQNIKKCLEAEYSHIYMISESKVHLKNIAKKAKEIIDKPLLKKVRYLPSQELSQQLDTFTQKKSKNNKRVRGYRVTSNHIDIASPQAEEKNENIQKIILTNIKPKKK